MSTVEESPFIDKGIKDQIQKWQLEEKFNLMINKIMKEKPDDPLCFLSEMMSSLTKKAPSFNNIFISKILDSVGQINLESNYTGNKIGVSVKLPTQTYEKSDNKIWIEDENVDNDKIINDAIEIFNNNCKNKLNNISIQEQYKIDDILKEEYLNDENNYNRAEKIIKHIISQGAIKAGAVLNDQSIIKYLYECQEIEEPEYCYSKPVIELLRGGKEAGSKLKWQKISLVPLHPKEIDEEDKDIENISIKLINNELNQILKIHQQLKKKSTEVHKSEKYFSTGAQLSPVDTIIDLMKLIQEVFNQCDIKITPECTTIPPIDQTFPERDQGICIDLNANEQQNESKKVYEIDGQKPLTNDEYCEFLLKFLCQNPMICMIKNAFSDQDKETEDKFLNKLYNEESDYATLGVNVDYTTSQTDGSADGIKTQFESLKSEETIRKSPVVMELDFDNFDTTSELQAINSMLSDYQFDDKSYKIDIWLKTKGIKIIPALCEGMSIKYYDLILPCVENLSDLSVWREYQKVSIESFMYYLNDREQKRD